MSALTAEKVATLDACFGTYPHTRALKDGAITSDRLALRFNEVEPINKAFLMMVRFQHGTMFYNSERGTMTPDSLPGRRVGVRAFSQTTGVWLRGILWKDYGVDLSKVRWITFEDA